MSGSELWLAQLVQPHMETRQIMRRERNAPVPPPVHIVHTIMPPRKTTPPFRNFADWVDHQGSARFLSGMTNRLTELAAIALERLITDPTYNVLGKKMEASKKLKSQQ